MKKEGISSDRNRRKKYVSKLQDGDQWIEHRKLPPANAKWPTCLIVCPNALVHNWEREFEKWGYFEVGMYMDNKKIRQPVLHDFVLGRLDVVITSYDFVQSDVELLCDLPWSCIFVDEVHKAKNDNSKTADALHQFQIRMTKCGRFWIGTNPGKVGTKKQWAKYVVKPLTDGQSTKATDEERAKSLTVARVLKDKLLPRSFLRRTKDIIKDQLPKKTDEVVFCPLSPAQVEAYRRILQTSEVQNLLKRNEQCDCGSPKTRKECCHPFQVANVFKYMSILIKLSNHLCLILPGSPDDTLEQAKRNRETATIAFPDGNVPVYGVAEMQPQFCGKWSACNVLFKEWRKDRTNKVLLFTKSVKLLKMLEYHLSRESYNFLKLDGSVPTAKRMDLIDQFQDDPNVFIFLVSTLAGGTGLNLTAANKVIIFDPNWNPAHDLQAMDRSYRFGQQRDVSVFRLLGAGSVEELIYARQIYKQQQMAIGYDASIQTRYFEGVQGDNSKRGELFGLENIFKLHEDKIATKMAIEKAHMSELDWALANLKVEKNKKIRVGEKTNALFEAEAKATAKDEISLNGLGALLFDDDPTIAEGDDLRKALGAIGVQYSHMNDEILVPSKIEEERAKQSMKKRGERTTRNKSKEAEKDQLQWPPRRKHHKAKAEEALTPEERLESSLYSRRQALIALGSITCPADLPGFARNFARETDDAQLAILAELDHWQSQHGG
ncbi:P-loop containing nucleoside triphosphate hydrolase protein [Coprinopsis sp. MPI-PUGE-AT-0042]|nr:P-loop containing nucleoside triphosphate hydrolase protein [Coprinopsis sp. MPI-PUGE-AT-0042]